MPCRADVNFTGCRSEEGGEGKKIYGIEKLVGNETCTTVHSLINV